MKQIWKISGFLNFASGITHFSVSLYSCEHSADQSLWKCSFFSFSPRWVTWKETRLSRICLSRTHADLPDHLVILNVLCDVLMMACSMTFPGIDVRLT